MNKIKKFLNLIDWNELGWSMGIFLLFFLAITAGMLITNTWRLDGKEINLFLAFGFILSLGINLIKQFK